MTPTVISTSQRCDEYIFSRKSLDIDPGNNSKEYVGITIPLILIGRILIPEGIIEGINGGIIIFHDHKSTTCPSIVQIAE